jgi:hypothetical protein
VRTSAALLLAALSLGFAPAPLPKPDKGKAAIKRELERLNDTWEVVSLIEDGTADHLPEGKLLLTLKDGKFTMRSAGEEVGRGTAQGKRI